MTTPNHQSDDYISFSGVKTFLTGILRLLFGILRVIGDSLKRFFWLLILGTVLGGCAGWLYHVAFGQKYKVAMIVEYRALDKVIYRNIVNDLNRMASYGSKQRLAAQLGVPPGLVENVNKLGTADLNGQPLNTDATPAPPVFQIVGELRSPEGADSLGHALIRYINGLPYLQSEIAGQLAIRREQLAYVQKEMGNIDSLKKENVFDPAAVYRHSYSLDSLRAQIRKYLIHGGQALSPVTEFRAADLPQSAPAWFVVGALAAAGFLLAFVVAFFWEIKTRVR
jgi:hypothetical protein